MKNIGNYIHWLPFLQFALILITFIATYSTAVALKHVHPVWPYISDTGTLPPESCIFSFLLNFYCLVLVLIIYIRHRQVEEFAEIRPYIDIRKNFNTISTVVGFLGVLGLAVAANFQETNEFGIHIFGALACFTLSTIYFFLQCILTYKMKFASKIIFWSRVIFTGLNVVAIISIFAPVQAAMDKFKGKDVLLWHPKDGGYEFHLISTISEWILVLSFCLYISTFYWEFRRFQLSSDKIKLFGTGMEEENKSERDQFGSVESNWL